MEINTQYIFINMYVESNLTVQLKVQKFAKYKLFEKILQCLPKNLPEKVLHKNLL